MAKHRIACENAVASRDDLERIYERNICSGFTASAQKDAAVFEEKFRSYLGQKTPYCGWVEMAKELRLIELACGPFTIGRFPASKIREMVEKATKRLEQGQALLKKLQFDLDYLAAIYSQYDPYAVRDREDNLGTLIQDLHGIFAWLDTHRPPKKWDDTARRQHRVRLAVLLIPLFEKEFGEEARPRGGNQEVPDDKSNDWTRFYQMAASVFFGEKITPGRQEILREAKREPIH